MAFNLREWATDNQVDTTGFDLSAWKAENVGEEKKEPLATPSSLVSKPWLAGAMEKGEDFAYNIMRDVPGFGASFPMMGMPPPLKDVAGLAGKAMGPIREKIEGLPFLAPLRDLEERAFGEKAVGEPLFEPEIAPQSMQEQIYSILKPMITGEVSVPETALRTVESTPVVGAPFRAHRDPESIQERPLPYLMDLAILLGGGRALAKGKAKPKPTEAKVPEIAPGITEKVVPRSMPELPEGIFEQMLGIEKPKAKPKKITVGEGVAKTTAKLKAEGVGEAGLRKPGWMSNKDFEMLKEYEATGRPVFIYPKTKEIALSGRTRPYRDAIKDVRDHFAPEPTPAPAGKAISPRREADLKTFADRSIDQVEAGKPAGRTFVWPEEGERGPIAPRITADASTYPQWYRDLTRDYSIKKSQTIKALKEIKEKGMEADGRQYVERVKESILDAMTEERSVYAQEILKERAKRGVLTPVEKELHAFFEKKGKEFKLTEEVKAKPGAKQAELAGLQRAEAEAITGKKIKKVTGTKAIKEEMLGRKEGEVLSGQQEFKPPELAKKGRKVRVTRKKEPVELGFLGTPEAAKALGESVVGGAKEISRLTSEMTEKMKTKPEIRAGVKESKEAMIEHDRQIRRAESTSKLFEKVIKDVVPDKGRQMEMVHAYEHKMKGPHWKGLTDLEQSMVEWVAKEKAKLNKFIKENDILEMMPESENINHIFHHWIDPKTGNPYKGMYGKFSKGLPQAKQRVIPTYESGIKKGYTPATTNIGKLVGLEWEATTRAHQSREMFKTLHNIGAEKGVEIQLVKGKQPKPIRMVERWDLLGKQGLTEDYVRYSHPALDKAITFKDVNETLIRLKGAVGVRKELFPFVKAYLESPNYGSLSKLNFATKSLKLGFSMFHVMSLGMQELANFRVPFKNIPRGLKEIRNLGPELRLLHQEGLELFKGYEDIGYRNKFFEGEQTWKKAGNFVTKPIEAMRTFIFDIVQPGMKASFALDKYNELLPKYLKKGLTKEQCARDVVKAADGHFSGEHYKRSLLETNRFMAKMYFSPGARKTWQAALLSPTWQREHLLVAKNVAKSFMPDRFIRKIGLSEIGPIKGEFRKYLLGATMLIGGVDLWNMYLTQKMDGEARHLWQNPPGKGFAIRAPWNEPGYTTTDKAGKERRVKGGPGYIRPLKSVFEVAEWVKTPFQKFIYKLSPIVTATGRQFWPSRYQKEYKGWPDMPRRVKDFVLDVSTPISASQIGSWAMGKKTPQAAAIPFFGFPTSKLSIKQTNKVYYERLAAIQRKHGRYSDQWRKVKVEFEDMGYKFNEKSYRAYLEEKEPTRGVLELLGVP